MLTQNIERPSEHPASQPAASTGVVFRKSAAPHDSLQLGYRLLRLVQERDEALGLVSDPVDPDTGVQIGIEKTQAAGVKYPTYTLRLGRQAAPIDRFFDRMDGDELDALCPLEETVRVIEPEHEWELLAKVVGVDLRDKIRAATIRP